MNIKKRVIGSTVIQAPTDEILDELEREFEKLNDEFEAVLIWGQKKGVTLIDLRDEQKRD